MKRDGATKFMKALGAKVPMSQPRSQWVISDCPLGPWRHTNGKSSPEVFGVKLGPGDSRCHCFSCDYHGTQRDLLIEMRALNKANPSGLQYPFAELMQLIAEAETAAELDLDIPDLEETLWGARKQHHPFDEEWLASFATPDGFPWATDYLLARDCWPAVWEELDLRVDTYQKRICFPVRDFNGTLMGLHGRAVDPDEELRYRMYQFMGDTNPDIWLGEHWVDLDKPIVVVEGPFDLASVYRVYRNVVTPLFANPSHAKLKRMSDAMEWVTLYDHGKGGDAGRAKVNAALPNHHKVHLLPPTGSKDPGDLGVQELQDLLGPHVILDHVIGG